MNLTDLLLVNSIDPKQVLVLRHRPREPQLNKVLPWLAAEKPNVYNAYQQTQSEMVERAMVRAKYVSSFIGQEPGKAIFVGLYEVKGAKQITREQFWAIPENKQLKSHGMSGFSEDSSRSSILWFDLLLTDFCAQWKGKLVINWPGLELSWYRWANKPQNKMPIHAILEDSALDAIMPEWNEIELSWDQLNLLPIRWKNKLREWRGIYYIFDISDGKGYVGAAYGEDNLYGRWINYTRSGHGGNHLLKKRDPQNFRFTILLGVSPDMNPDEVIQLETSWKHRLHTRAPYGLNDN